MRNSHSPNQIRRRRRLLAAVVLLAALGVAAGLVTVAYFSSVHWGHAHSRVEILSYATLVALIVVVAGILLIRQGRVLTETSERLIGALDERRRTDMALREAEARLYNVLGGALTGILIHRDLHPLYVNSALVGILGYESVADLMSLASVLDVVVPDDRERVRAFHVQRLRGDVVEPSLEIEALRKDGQVIRLDMSVRPIMWGGEPVVYIAMSDVTERRRAEEALRLSEARLSRAQRIAQLGNWERDFKSGALWWSRETFEIFGKDPASFDPTYDGFLACVHPDDREMVKDAVVTALENHAGYRVDHRIVLADGAIRHVNEQGEFHYDDDGTPVALSGTVHDITERKLNEQRLRDSEVRHRNFAADVAHELRTPLSVMRANLDNMGDGAGLAALRQDVDAMSRMVEQLLAASRAEMLSIGPDSVADLHGVAVSVATHLAPLAIQQGRLIAVAGEERAVPVRGDGEALEQAVRNLVENAIKYSTPNSTVTIRVSASPPTLSVINEGVRVPSGEREAIFNRFTRADRRVGGAGLGLSIVQRIVDAHGGLIQVGDPEEGEGAVFTLTVPAA